MEFDSSLLEDADGLKAEELQLNELTVEAIQHRSVSSSFEDRSEIKTNRIPVHYSIKPYSTKENTSQHHK